MLKEWNVRRLSKNRKDKKRKEMKMREDRKEKKMNSNKCKEYLRK